MRKSLMMALVLLAATSLASGVGKAPRSPEPQAPAVTPIQVLNTWLVGATWVTPHPEGGLSYHDCYDVSRYTRMLADTPKGQAFVAALARHPGLGGDLMTAINPLREQFEARLTTTPGHESWTAEQLTHAFHAFISENCRDCLTSVLPSLKQVVIEANLVPDGDFDPAPTAQADPQETPAPARDIATVSSAIIHVQAMPDGCTTLPCCGPNVPTCNDCSKYRCDCGVCGAGRKCSCKTIVDTYGTCQPPALTCNTDDPVKLSHSAVSLDILR